MKRARARTWLGARDNRGALGLILLSAIVVLQGLLQFASLG